MPVAATAQVRPKPGPGDPRIQSVLYDTNQVVQLQVATGYQLTVEFALDERIENVAVGDSGAWQVTPNKRGDHLFIKALQSGVTTNLTVVTDARSYMFDLAPLYGPLPDMAYTVRFTYPPTAVATVADATPAVAPGRYKLGGTRAIRPSQIDDDGEKTYIVWPADKPLPAVFAIDEKGREMLVDGCYARRPICDRQRQAEAAVPARQGSGERGAREAEGEALMASRSRPQAAIRGSAPTAKPASGRSSRCRPRACPGGCSRSASASSRSSCSACSTCGGARCTAPTDQAALRRRICGGAAPQPAPLFIPPEPAPPPVAVETPPPPPPPPPPPRACQQPQIIYVPQPHAATAGRGATAGARAGPAIRR